MKAIIGVDAGGQSFKTALIDAKTLSPLSSVEFLGIDSLGTRDALLGDFIKIVEMGLKQAKDQNIDVTAVAFSAPGPVDYHRGISLMDHKWSAIKGVSIPDALHASTIPASTPVFFCHDAHSLIYGEIATHAVKGQSTAGFIIGTGLGFGIIRNNLPEWDEKGTPKFGLWKTPYLDGKLEDYVASRGIPKLYDGIVGFSANLSAKDIGYLADEGNREARLAYEKMGTLLAEKTHQLFKDYSVDSIVFGGRISNSFHIFGPAFTETLETFGLAIPEICQVAETETLSIQGAAYHAICSIERGTI
ncbi:MAG: hypothetical protein PWP25_1665 [Sphaerochaeta sp.]|nr:hypothetical protein [Sphaerochaeta sp.]